MNWFKKFEELQDRLPKRPATRLNRIKIAILDTGIDLENDWIAYRAGRIRCWPDNQKCIDRNGHGTHVAYLILRIAPHVQIYVVKVTAANDLGTVDIPKIAEVMELSNLNFGSAPLTVDSLGH